METAIPQPDQAKERPDAVVLFDGVCNLCNASVRFIIRRDPYAYFHFASLQSPIADELLRAHALPEEALTSVVYIERGRAYTRSDAALRIAAHLRGPWRLLAVLRFVPRFIRDAVYDWVALHRYRWFGKLDACAATPPALKERFLDA